MPNLPRRALLAFAVAAMVFGCATAGANSDLPAGAEREIATVVRPAPTSPTHRAATHDRKPKPTLGERAARIALRAVGVPYQWGGTSPASGFDCSGLVYWAYGRLGIAVPHSSYALYSEGRGIARSKAKAGDVLVFSGLGHVGLYVGRGRMVHAPHSGARVEVIKLGSSHYSGQIVSVRRIARG
jgi:cell wall-associated NlpC family hydrolase